MKRRDFLKAAVAAPLVLPHAAFAAAPDAAALPKFGNARIIHLTDTHAQLAPALYREPSANIGVGAARGKPPHLVGTAFLDRWKIAPGSREAYAFACLDFDALAKRYGKMGGFDRLATIVKRLRADAPRGDAMLVDGGDLMQGSGLAKLTAGADMIAAANLLGVEALTGHWEFTYGQDRLRAALKEFKGTFVAQNVFLTEDAAFNGAEAFDQASGRVFPPYVVRSFGDRRVGLIGQAFPYVPVAHPKRFTPDWTFGLRETELKALVEVLRTKEKVDAVVLLSHDGMDVDLKLASRVPGLDVVLGGHTHDATPAPVAVANSGGTTHVVNGGCNGKFVGSLDLDLAPGKLAGLRYRLLPVFADLVAPDAEMAALVGKLRAPHAALLDAPLATPGRALWRRGNFDGPTDDAICVALLEGLDCQIALSPGFRWGTTLAAGEPARMEDLLAQTAITYGETYATAMTGAQVKSAMEDVCDNLFNPDPYYQQGGDMVRAGGFSYSCRPDAPSGARIGDMTLADGSPLDPAKTYKVAGWASVSPQGGKDVADLVAAHWASAIAKAPPKPVTLLGDDRDPGYIPA